MRSLLLRPLRPLIATKPPRRRGGTCLNGVCVAAVAYILGASNSKTVSQGGRGVKNTALKFSFS